MRIVVDSETKGFKTAKRWVLCISLMFLMFILCGIISQYTGWDSDFFEGYFSCVIIGYAMGGGEK